VRLVVEITAGARRGQRLEFTDPDVVRFGRHPTCDVAFDPVADRDASSRHAELRREGAALFLQDLGSANGTRVGGAPVAGRALVPPGAEIEFGAGGPRCRVVYDAPAADGTVPPTMYKSTSDARPAPAAAATGPKVGHRTVSMMIEQAMARMRRGSTRLKYAVIALAVALVAGVAVVVVVWRLRPPPDVALTREMVKIMDAQRAASAGEQAALQRRLDELQAKLARARGGAVGSEVARAAHDALFLVIVRSPTGSEEGFCTAFAVGADRLVTNAHCVAAAEDLRKRGGSILVVQNGHPDVRIPVERMRRISGFAGGGTISPDVGCLRVAGGLLHPVQLAARAEYLKLQTGDPMFTYGFPGRLADPSAPEATFVEGVIGRITTLDGRGGEAKDTQLIQHSAYTSGGTSGSPIFDAEGHVVAVNTGGYAEQTANAQAAKALPGYNFGMRVDLVELLLGEADE
jgi:S1-C subfamily serine protease